MNDRILSSVGYGTYRGEPGKSKRQGKPYRRSRFSSKFHGFIAPPLNAEYVLKEWNKHGQTPKDKTAL